MPLLVCADEKQFQMLQQYAKAANQNLEQALAHIIDVFFDLEGDHVLAIYYRRQRLSDGQSKESNDTRSNQNPNHDSQMIDGVQKPHLEIVDTAQNNTAEPAEEE